MLLKKERQIYLLTYQMPTPAVKQRPEQAVENSVQILDGAGRVPTS